MAQLPVANLPAVLPQFSNANGFPSATSIIPVQNIPAVFGAFGLTFGVLAPTFFTYPMFDPATDTVNEWPSGIFMTPIKPLPINGSGGGGGPVGYGF